MTRMMELGRWARYALLVIAGLLVVWLLVTLLVQRPVEASVAEPTATPTATAEAEPVVALPDDPDRRFLAMDADGALWRGTAGSCADGIAPTLESTTDAVTWTPSLPAGATQLLALTAGEPVVADASCAAPDGFAPVVAPAGAVLAADEPYTARQDPDCAGVLLTSADTSWSVCADDLDPAGRVAIDATDDTLYVWSGAVLRGYPFDVG